jgi:hypothetical protein
MALQSGSERVKEGQSLCNHSAKYSDFLDSFFCHFIFKNYKTKFVKRSIKDFHLGHVRYLKTFAMAISKIPHRLTVTTRDICNITGASPATARRMLSRLRHKLGKSRHQVVTVRELCKDLAIPEDYLAEFMKL